jgi:hypothetical protein
VLLRRLEEVDSNSHSVERLRSLGFILKYGVYPRLGNSTHPFFFKFPVSFVSILRNARLAAKAKKWRPGMADPNGIGIKIYSTTFRGDMHLPVFFWDAPGLRRRGVPRF